MTASSAASIPRVKIKTIAIPSEHGGWGFLLEPLLLSLLVAPSAAGLCIAIATAGAFLTRHPLKILMTDRRRNRRFTRTIMAERFVLLYGSIAGVAMMAALILAGIGFLWPLLLAAPVGLLQFLFDSRAESRHWLPEFAGPVALAVSAPMIGLAGGLPVSIVLALWAVLVARSIPAIVYVRARLRLAKGRPASAPMALLAHLIATVVVALLAALQVAPILAIVASGILLLRAIYGLFRSPLTTSPRAVGFQEIGYGLITALLTAFGYHLGL